MSNFDIKKSIIENIIKLTEVRPSEYKNKIFSLKIFTSKTDNKLHEIQIYITTNGFSYNLISIDYFHDAIHIRNDDDFDFYTNEKFNELAQDLSDESYTVLKYGRDYFNISYPNDENEVGGFPYEDLNDFLLEVLENEKKNNENQL